MNKYRVNFEKVNTYYDFYNEIIKGLNLPDWCGQNPDAVLDLLTGYFSTLAEITVTGMENIPVNLLAEWQICKNFYRCRSVV